MSKTGLHDRKSVIDIPDRSNDDDAPAYVAARRFAAEVAEHSTPEGAARMKDMLAARRAPGHRVEGGNDSFFQHRGNNQQLDEMHESVRDKYLEKAKAAGVSVHGKVYSSTLANEPGDPFAWVSETSELRAKAEARGLDGEGLMNFKAKKPKAPLFDRRAAKVRKRKAAQAQQKQAVA